MTYKIHLKHENGGGTIFKKFASSSDNSAIKKAEELIKDSYLCQTAKSITLSRCLRGNSHMLIKKLKGD